MGYLISFGIGLLLGLAALIWAVRERSARARAEQSLAKAETYARELDTKLTTTRGVVVSLQDEIAREKAHTAGLRAALESAQQRLVDCNDPAAIRAWVTATLQGKEP